MVMRIEKRRGNTPGKAPGIHEMLVAARRVLGSPAAW